MDSSKKFPDCKRDMKLVTRLDATKKPVILIRHVCYCGRLVMA